jgi:hypothetical protein
LAVIKKTKPTERTALELKGEFFDAFNHTRSPRLGHRNEHCGNDIFGWFSAHVQLAMKFEF